MPNPFKRLALRILSAKDSATGRYAFINLAAGYRLGNGADFGQEAVFRHVVG